MRALLPINHSKILVLNVEDTGWGLALTHLREVVHFSRLTPPPTGLESVEGFLDLAGEQIPVIRLASLLSSQSDPIGLYTPIVVLKTPSVALWVDGVGDVISLSADSIAPIPPNHALNNFVEGQFEHRGHSLFLIDPHKLFLEEEKRRLQGLQLEYQRRLARSDCQA